MSRFINPDVGFILKNGNPNALGKVYFGDPNTDAKTNPKAPFLDAALTTEAATTQKLDAGGKLTQGLFFSGSYSVIADDSEDIQVDEVLNYAGFPDQASEINYTSTATVEQRLDNLDEDGYSDIRALVSSELEDGDSVRVTNSGVSGVGYIRKVTAHGLSDDSGTIIVLDVDTYWERDFHGRLNAKWYGLSTDGTPAANKTAMDAVISASFSLRKTVYIPMGFYECDKFVVDPSGTQRTFKMVGDHAGRTGEIIPNSADSIKQYASCLFFPNITGTDTAIEFGSIGGVNEQHRPVLEDFYLLGPNLEAGIPTTNTTGLRFTDGIRDPIISRVSIAQFRTGIVTGDVFVFTSYSLGISRCQVGAIWGQVSNRMAHYDITIKDCSYGAFHTGTGSADYFCPWFEGQLPTSTREMEHAVVIGSQSDDVADISFYGGWFEQIQKEAISVGVRDDGNGAGGGATPNFVPSGGTIKRVNLFGSGHWDSVGGDVSGAKVRVDASATGIEDGCVRIFSDLGNWDFSQLSGPSSKVQSGNNFQNHVGNGLAFERWVTESGDGGEGGTNAGLKTGLTDNTAKTFANFAVPNFALGATFRVTYEIMSATERSVVAGDVLVALGRKSGVATQGGVGTVNNITVNTSSTESNSVPVFSFTNIQAKDTADTTKETIGLQVTQDNTNSSSGTMAYTIEQVSGTRQAGVGTSYVTVTQA